MNIQERIDRRKAIAQAVKDRGYSTEDCVRDFGVSWTTVRSACCEYGVTPPRQLAAKAKEFSNYEALASLINTDLSLQEIANIQRVSKQRISQIYKRCLDHGIPVRNRPHGGRHN